MFLRGSKALCLVNRNHIGDFLSGIEEAACPGARLDILEKTALDNYVSVRHAFQPVFGSISNPHFCK